MPREMISRRRLAGVIHRVGKTCSRLKGDLSGDVLVIYSSSKHNANSIGSYFRGRYNGLDICIVRNTIDFSVLVRENIENLYGIILDLDEDVIDTLGVLSNQFDVFNPVIALYDEGSRYLLRKLGRMRIDFSAKVIDRYIRFTVGNK